MGKRMRIFLLSAALLTAAMPAFSEGTSPEAFSPEAAENAGTTVEQETTEKTPEEEETGGGNTGETQAPEKSGGGNTGETQESEGPAVDVSEENNTEELKKTLDQVYNLVSSEEVQELMAYPEVRELVKELIFTGAEMTADDKELTQEVLVAAGMSEQQAQFAAELVCACVEASGGKEQFRESSLGKMIEQAVDGDLNEEEMNAVLEAMIQTLFMGEIKSLQKGGLSGGNQSESNS